MCLFNSMYRYTYSSEASLPAPSQLFLVWTRQCCTRLALFPGPRPASHRLQYPGSCPASNSHCLQYPGSRPASNSHCLQYPGSHPASNSHRLQYPGSRPVSNCYSHRLQYPGPPCPASHRLQYCKRREAGWGPGNEAASDGKLVKSPGTRLALDGLPVEYTHTPSYKLYTQYLCQRHSLLNRPLTVLFMHKYLHISCPKQTVCAYFKTMFGLLWRLNETHLLIQLPRQPSKNKTAAGEIASTNIPLLSYLLHLTPPWAAVTREGRTQGSRDSHNQLTFQGQKS